MNTNVCVAFMLLIIIYIGYHAGKWHFTDIRFQHNFKVKVDKETYEYVRQYKSQLLFNIDKLLDDLNIKYVIAHGNLIEYVRNKPIYHDDDLDIRFDVDDFWKWEKYCKDLNNVDDYKYNLKYDHRIFDIEKQLFNGIQIRLIKFMNPDNIKEFNLDIHCDLVASRVDKKDSWMDYYIDYSKLRRVNFLEVDTYVPSEDDTDRILTKQYGKNYIIPNYKICELT